MNYADYKRFDVLNGRGLRHSLFVSGCSHQCSMCFNREAWDSNFGEQFTKEIENKIIADLQKEKPYIQGLSILGGEPFENLDGLFPLVERVRKECPEKDIWIWSGYTYEQIIKDENKLKLLTMCDMLIDGKYIHKLRDLTLKWRGSSNQRVIDIRRSLQHGKLNISE